MPLRDNVFNESLPFAPDDETFCLQCAPLQCYGQWQCKADAANGNGIWTESNFVSGKYHFSETGDGGFTVIDGVPQHSNDTFVRFEHTGFGWHHSDPDDPDSWWTQRSEWRIQPIWDVAWTPPPNTVRNVSMGKTCMQPPVIPSDVNSMVGAFAELGIVDKVPPELRTTQCENSDFGDQAQGKVLGGRVCYSHLKTPGLPQSFKESIAAMAIAYVFVVVHKAVLFYTEYREYESPKEYLKQSLCCCFFYLFVAGPLIIADIVLPLMIMAPVSKSKSYPEPTRGSFITMNDYGFLPSIFVMIALICLGTQDVLVERFSRSLKGPIGRKLFITLLILLLLPVYVAILTFTAFGVVNLEWPLLGFTVSFEFDFTWGVAAVVDIVQILSFILVLNDCMSIVSQQATMLEQLGNALKRLVPERRSSGSVGSQCSNIEQDAQGSSE